jgi:hypothetical protein
LDLGVAAQNKISPDAVASVADDFLCCGTEGFRSWRGQPPEKRTMQEPTLRRSSWQCDKTPYSHFAT